MDCVGIQADFGDLPPAIPTPPPLPPIGKHKGKPPAPTVPPPKSDQPSSSPSSRSIPSPKKSRTPSPKRSPTPSPKRSPTPSPKRSKTPSPERSKTPTREGSGTPSPQAAERPEEPKPSTSAAEPHERPKSDTSRDDSLFPISHADQRRSDYGDRASSHFSDWTFPMDCSIQVTSHDIDKNHRYLHSEVTMNDHTSSMAVTLEKKLNPNDHPLFAHRPANYLPLTICCVIINPLFGVMACIASLLSIREFKQGNEKEAKRHGRNAAILALVAVLVTIVIVVISLSVVLTGAVPKAVVVT